MNYDLSTFLKSINFEKKNLLTDKDADLPPDDIEKAYLPFVVNRCLSYFPDTILYAQEMNLRGGLDKRLQYEYLLYTIRKRKRFSPWQKAEQPENLEAVKEYYGFNNSKAIEALKILKSEDLQMIKESLNLGGLKTKGKVKNK